MSLATTGGGGLGGAGAGGAASGIAMAHHAGAVGPPPQAPPTHHEQFQGAAASAGGVPTNAAYLGADLVDKQQQQLQLRQVRNVSHLPVVAVDLHGTEPVVAMFPPKPSDCTTGQVPAVVVGKMKSALSLRATEQSRKTMRKFLAGSVPYRCVQSDCLCHGNTSSATSGSASDTVVLDRPARWLGLRRTADAPDHVRDGVVTEPSNSSPAIAEETIPDVGVAVANSSLDGQLPAGDDDDRVVFKVKFVPSKKALTVLPEEAVQLVFHQAQYHVSTKFNKTKNENKKNSDNGNNNNNEGSDDGEGEMEDYPLAVALPAFYRHDAAVEAVLEAASSACGGNTPGVLFPRPVCALAGALQPPLTNKPNAVLERIQQVRQAMDAQYRRELARNPDAVPSDEILIILAGICPDGVEATAIQIGACQPDYPTTVFGNYKVLSNVSYQHDEPLSLVGKVMGELESAIEILAPEADGPAAICTYGTVSEQEEVKKLWAEERQKATSSSSTKAKATEWSKVPVLATRMDCVAVGTAILGAVAHGRCSILSARGPEQKQKVELALRVEHVAPVAVGIQYNYRASDDDEDNKSNKSERWTEPKTLFAFDRRVPAGPYPIEFKASECAVHRARGNEASSSLSEEEFLKAVSDKEGRKRIPERERAALNLQVQILERWTRDGEWKRVGDPMEPLVKLDHRRSSNNDDDDGEGGERIACESVVLELSLGMTGMITTALVGERESVVQAVKTARRNRIAYWAGTIFAVLFFGGFMARSWWEEYAFKRDTKRILAYYKHVIPGSINDGDENGAKLLAWKYRHKRAKLWRLLEKKYGVPVRHAHEWPPEEEEEEEEEKGAEEDDEDDESETADEREEAAKEGGGDQDL